MIVPILSLINRFLVFFFFSFFKFDVLEFPCGTGMLCFFLGFAMYEGREQGRVFGQIDRHFINWALGKYIVPIIKVNIMFLE